MNRDHEVEGTVQTPKAESQPAREDREDGAKTGDSIWTKKSKAIVGLGASFAAFAFFC